MKFNCTWVCIAFIVALTAPTLGLADRYDSLFEEFDARPLRYDEKRFLQGALALQGYYYGLLDGAWGSGSQNAIERYSADNYQDIPYNIHMATLGAFFHENDAVEGWASNYLNDLGLSIILPMRNLRLVEQKAGYKYWVHNSNSLTISASILSPSDMLGLHDEILQGNSQTREPYAVRNQNRWVTSIQRRNGNSVYIRSDLIGQNWSTILLTAASSDKNKLIFVSSSISIGHTVPFVFPEGGALESNVSLTLSWIESTESTSSQPSGAETRAPTNADSTGSTGTGFYVDGSGSVLTNAHVVENCDILTVNEEPYLISAQSTEFDLALLHPSEPKEIFVIANFANRPAKLNADVTVAGYPLHGILGGLNVTRGSVASLSGIGGDSLRMQISAPVQPGNSGGPVLGRSGDVIGVVVSKLDGLRVAEATGDIPQNINFAIRGEIAKLFLSSNNIGYSISELTERVEPTVIAESASGFTVLIKCR